MLESEDRIQNTRKELRVSFGFQVQWAPEYQFETQEHLHVGLFCFLFVFFFQSGVLHSLIQPTVSVSWIPQE